MAGPAPQLVHADEGYGLERMNVGGFGFVLHRAIVDGPDDVVDDAAVLLGLHPEPRWLRGSPCSWTRKTV